MCECEDYEVGQVRYVCVSVRIVRRTYIHAYGV